MKAESFAGCCNCIPFCASLEIIIIIASSLSATETVTAVVI